MKVSQILPGQWQINDTKLVWLKIINTKIKITIILGYVDQRLQSLRL